LSAINEISQTTPHGFRNCKLVIYQNLFMLTFHLGMTYEHHFETLCLVNFCIEKL